MPKLTKVELQEENERLKAAIICDCDNMAAYAPFDEHGNYANHIWVFYINLKDIIPELKEFVEEVRPILIKSQAEMRRLIGV